MNLKQELNFIWYVIKHPFKETIDFKFNKDEFFSFFRRPSKILDFLFYLFLVGFIFRNIAFIIITFLLMVAVYVWKERTGGKWREELKKKEIKMMESEEDVKQKSLKLN